VIQSPERFLYTASLAVALLVLAPCPATADAVLSTAAGAAAKEKTASRHFASQGGSNVKGTLTLAAEKRWGHDYMHARYYSPGTVGNSQSWNRYSYVHNNPLAYVDPTGMRWALVYGEERDVEPGDVVTLTKEDDQNKGTHTAVVGDFREPEVEGGLPTALVYENTPQGNGLSKYEDASPHQPTLVDSSSPLAGGGEWNAQNSQVGSVSRNMKTLTDGTKRPFTASEVASAVQAVGPVKYNNLFAGSLGSTCDCAGFVNSVVLQLKMNGGTLSPYTRTGSGKQTKNVTDWLLEGRQ
jgi:RHS repeat-associated protein